MEGDRNAQVTMVTRVFKEASRRRGLSRRKSWVSVLVLTHSRAAPFI